MASLITNAIGKWHRHHQSKRLMQFGTCGCAASTSRAPSLAAHAHHRTRASFLLPAGLMWHDVVADGPILDKAVARLPKEMQERRERRIRRCVAPPDASCSISEVCRLSGPPSAALAARLPPRPAQGL